MNRTLALLMTTVSLISWEALAYNNPHILEVDLDIEGVVDPAEFSPGGPGGFVAKDGWKRIFLKYTGTNLPTKTRLNWDSEKIEVYEGTNGEPQVFSDIYWDPASTMPTQLWVKGVEASDSGPEGTNCGPEHLCLEAINNGTDYFTPLYDRIAFTVYEVTNIVAIPKGITTNDTLPDPVTIGAGALDSEAHQADVTIQITPPISGVPVDVSLLDGRGHDAGKDAKLVMGTTTATGGCAAVTVQTGTGGEIPGVLTSSDVLNNGTIHAGETDKTVAFTWDEWTEDEEWTNTQAYLPFPGVLTNYVVLRHHRNLASCTQTNPAPYKPFIGHEIHFFVEQVEYWDTNGVLCVTNNTPPVSGGLSDFAAFVQETYTTDGGGQVVPLLQVYTNYDISRVTMVAYDYSVWEASTISGAGAGGSGGTAGNLQQKGEGSGVVTLQQQSTAVGHPSTHGTGDDITVQIRKCEGNWEPKGGTNDNTTTFFAFVTPSTVKGSFKFTLFDVSDEPGYCLNAPQTIVGPEDSDTWKDLQFLPGQSGFTISGASNEFAETTATNLSDATVTVKCFDFGAYGKIKAVFTPQDGSAPRTAKEEGGTKEHANIPRDEAPENHIWDGAPQNTGPGTNAVETDDLDNDPADITAIGDQITRYEEYRGFMVNNIHTRTSVTKRDLFIYDENGIGLGYYPTASDIECHRILANEWTGPGSRYDNMRIVDFNRGSWCGPLPDYPIFGMRLIQRTLGAGVLGECRDDPTGAVTTGAGAPHRFLEVVVDTAKCSGYGAYESWAIAHEIGHSTCLKHHDASHFPDNGKPTNPLYWGDKTCVMRYIADPYDSGEIGSPWSVTKLCPTNTTGAGYSGCKQEVNVISPTVIP